MTKETVKSRKGKMTKEWSSRILRDKFFYRAVFTEFFSTAFFLYLVTSLLVSLSPKSIVQISFCIGMAISVLAQTFGPISGAHINPAVTVGIMVTGKLSFVWAVCYVIAQIVGGIAGAGVTFALTPRGKVGALGCLSLADGLSPGQGFFVEMLLTMVLVFTVLASTDEKRGHVGFLPALAIGLSITVTHLAGIQYTGSGINPARAFGPAVVLGVFPSYHWVYWAGPLLGGLLAGALYKWLFGVPEEAEGGAGGKDEVMENMHSTELKI